MFNFQTMNNMISMMNQFKSNPVQMLSQRFKIPADVNDPEKIIQHLLDTNQVTQAQIDTIKAYKDNPMFAQLFK